MPYTPGYTDPRFTGAKPTGQFNTTQTYQTPSFLEDKAAVLGKEIKGGHLVKYKSLLTENTYSGILPSRRQKGMLVFVEQNDDDTDLSKFYYLKNPPGNNISDWEELTFQSALNVYVVADIAARDALTGLTTGDIAIVEDCRTPAEVTAGDPVYSCIYAWDGTTWKRLDFLADIDPTDVAANTLARHTQNTDIQLIRDSNGDPLTADYIFNQLQAKAEINDGTTSTSTTWSSTKISGELDSHLQEAKDYTYSQQEIDQQDLNTLNAANQYTDDQIANFDQYQSGNGINITGASNPKTIAVDPADLATQAVLDASWVPVVTEGTKFYINPSQINVASGAFTKSWQGTTSETTFTIGAGEGPIASIIAVFVGGAIQSPDEYSHDTDTLTLTSGLLGDVEVILIYSKVVSGTDSAATIAYVDAQIDAIKGGNETDTLQTLRDDLDNVQSDPSYFNTFFEGHLGNGISTTFTLGGRIDGFLFVEVNESTQTSGFSRSGSNLIFSTPPENGAVIKVGYFTYTSTAPSTNPTLTISSLSGSTTTTSPITVQLVSSVSITGLTVGEINVTNGAAQNLTGSGINYQFEVVPSAIGLVTIQIPAGVAQDGSGAQNAISNEITVDYQSPISAPSITATTISDTEIQISLQQLGIGSMQIGSTFTVA